MAQKSYMDAACPIIDIDDWGHYCRQPNAKPVRRSIGDPQNRRVQADAATVQIVLNSLAPTRVADPIGIDVSSLGDACFASPIQRADSDRRRRFGGPLVVIEESIFDQRRDDLVKRAAPKTKGQQPAVFAVSQG
jgi:hypothetical protein